MTATTFDHNRLDDTSSPYLRQHADNPVHWQPWDEVALAHARETGTPILLSIGYSACHWCHVMAHECFENPKIAALMNASFVNIKLDREERPDIDRVYQLAHQALSQRGGGWPLTAFLDPQNLSPFYIGTYFPPTPRHGLPGFPEVLQRVRAYFDSNRDELRAHAEQLQTWMQHAEAGKPGDTPDADSASTEALRRAESRFDARWGGNAGAPKFPRATEIEWLLDKDSHAAHDMARLTLANMAARGLQDHLGGGFFRYCVDANWTIPHFEKMLYDNAQLLPAYARLAVDPDAGASLREAANAAVGGIVDWLARDMTSPSGAFYSSLDADSDGEEGKFYLWTREQMKSPLTETGFALAELAFGLDASQNYEGKAWHLLRDAQMDDIARKLGGSIENTRTEYAAVRRQLFDTRERRDHPARDDKILTAWNALAISGLARAARLLDDARSADMALRALNALRESTWIEGALSANAAQPPSRIPGFLDDHGFLLDALLETLQLTFATRDLEWAIALAEALLDKFADRDAGGFWFSTPAHGTPLARSRSWTDDALPNGNAVAIRSLLRLGHLTGDTRYLESAERALRAGSNALHQYPDACATLLRALNEFERPRPQIVVRCTTERAPAWKTALQTDLHATGLATGGAPADIFIIPSDAGPLPGILAAREARGAEGTAWICSGLTCQTPVTSPGALANALQAGLSA
ncbi:MAG TPA: thioredoxin domain-containing protein [Rhodanobacteraceae bacterium]|nr:thioredoxin domain-containing protein [Rhodanobacteraceae bacterium]